MKIESVTVNNRKRSFEIEAAGERLAFPFAKAVPQPAPDDPVASAFVDAELGGEGFTYVLSSGAEGTVHVEQVLDYNRDPAYLREAMLYALTLEAQRRIAEAGLPKREIMRRLGTSASQFYRLIDQTNSAKSLDQMVALLSVLGYDVDVTVTRRAG